MTFAASSESQDENISASQSDPHVPPRTTNRASHASDLDTAERETGISGLDGRRGRSELRIWSRTYRFLPVASSAPVTASAT